MTNPLCMGRDEPLKALHDKVQERLLVCNLSRSGSRIVYSGEYDAPDAIIINELTMCSKLVIIN